jgi:hypothetical protein
MAGIVTKRIFQFSGHVFHTFLASLHMLDVTYIFTYEIMHEISNKLVMSIHVNPCLHTTICAYIDVHKKLRNPWEMHT